jgi:hypothetical protein
MKVMHSKLGTTNFLRNHYKLAKEVFRESNLKTLKSKIFLDLARKALGYTVTIPNQDIYISLQKCFHKKGANYDKKIPARRTFNLFLL